QLERLGQAVKTSALQFGVVKIKMLKRPLRSRVR
ncbi:hypothetical protein GGD83_004863, partial [Rhodoblastus sphagnicola]|nr:hypothetical protein [Rhodoblastus sphagnicola]